ncbi:hypothetical protein MPL1032_140042 [Mesorhizobium plurifarium]|uniref:Uncharacterized protein n=1 Tax=Mesorhizobium plurifarium TaxID=69974 RepID=A0A0K2VR81_MESPL|nr:hypothetical protein MPL1032_140042 [Mesorhizobium plurifarium]
MNAACTGCSSAPSASPSMVTMVEPDACAASIVQDFTALPSTCTTQAPHCDVSQPTCVPVRPRCSRRKCTSNVRSSALPLTRFPFTVNDTSDIQPLPGY